jgi:hypothetical protein
MTTAPDFSDRQVIDRGECIAHPAIDLAHIARG